MLFMHSSQMPKGQNNGVHHNQGRPETGVEHNCDEMIDFETHEALELHNSKTGRWNQLKPDETLQEAKECTQ